MRISVMHGFCRAQKGERREVDAAGYGILKGHAYSLIDVQSLRTGASGGADGQENRLLRVRNPWGQRVMRASTVYVNISRAWFLNRQ